MRQRAQDNRGGLFWVRGDWKGDRHFRWKRGNYKGFFHPKRENKKLRGSPHKASSAVEGNNSEA